jgi:soluble lytic murein transglycosylase-like protein
MLKRLLPVILLFAAPAVARAQQPLSPPEHSPVPLTDKDQERAREEFLKLKGAPKKAASGIPGRHISSGNPAIDALAYDAAARYHLDPCLILSVMHAESAYNRSAVSPKGASGLMQLMPATAVRFGVKNLFDPKENIIGGANYLRWLLDRFGGDVRLALAGYNAGEGAVELYGYRIPPFLETQSYVQLIYSRYSRIHNNTNALTPEPRPAAATVAAKEKSPTYNQIIRFTSSDGEGNKQ